jgi:hypothetical protein
MILKTTSIIYQNNLSKLVFVTNIQSEVKPESSHRAYYLNNINAFEALTSTCFVRQKTDNLRFMMRMFVTDKKGELVDK